MILVIVTALTAVCGAAKLNQGYLPPITAKTSGGSPGDLQAPFVGSNQGFGGFPTGSYTNDAQGVVVDAVNPGTRTSGAEPTGLGGPRTSYGSTDSRVGEAAFRGPVTSFGGLGGASTRIAPGFDSLIAPEGSEADKTRASTLKFASDVGSENYSYEYKTDNGISVGENGVAANGVQAQGGYSYKGDDGKTYSVKYTADEGGYKPQGHHLPTPPPIPDEILKSLEKNAKEEAAGLVDDGSYDAQKYNEEGDYSSSGAGNNNNRPTIGGSDVTSSSSFVSAHNQAQRPSLESVASHNSKVYDSQAFSQLSGNKHFGFGLNKDQSGSQGLGAPGSSSSIGGQFGQAGLSGSQYGHNSGSHGQFSAQGIQTPPHGTDLFSHQTQNRFGVQATKPKGDEVSGSTDFQSQAFNQGTVSGSQFKTPGLHRSPGSSNLNSAYSSAVTTGSGSASAFASTGPAGFGLKNDYDSSLNTFGSSGQFTHGSELGSDSSTGASFPKFAAASPSTASASASVNSEAPTTGYQSSESGLNKDNLLPVNALSSIGKVNYGSNAQGAYAPTLSSTPNYHSHSQSPNSPSSVSTSAFALGNQPAFVQPNQFNGFNTVSSSGQSTKFAQNTNIFPSRLGETQSHSSQTISSESSSVKPLGSYSSETYTQSQTNSGNLATSNVYLPPVNIIESTGKPIQHSQPQGSDSSSAVSIHKLEQFGQHSAKVPSSGSTKLEESGSSSPGGSSQQTAEFQPQSLNSKPGEYLQTNSKIPSSSSLYQAQIGSAGIQFASTVPIATQPTLGFESLTDQGPTKVPDTELTTPFESSVKPAAKPSSSVFNYQKPIPAAHNKPIPSSAPLSSFSSSFQQASQTGSIFQSQSNFPNQVASGQYKPQPSQSSFIHTAGQYKPQPSQISFTHTGSNDATFVSSTQQPALSQQQGIDNSYYYRQPSKPFITPVASLASLGNNQFSNIRQPNYPVSSLTQQGSKYSNTPTTSTTGQYQSSTSSTYNGITQAAISPFPSGSSIPSKQFGSQFSQFGLKPTLSTQFSQTSSANQQTSTKFGESGTQQNFPQKLGTPTGLKPIVQSQTQFSQSSISQASVGSEKPVQQYQGTVYEYSKPAESLPAPQHIDTSSNSASSTQIDSQAKPSQISTDSRLEPQQGSAQLIIQPFGHSLTESNTLQQTQTAHGSTYGSQSNSPFVEKTSNGAILATSQGQTSQTLQFGQKQTGSLQTNDLSYNQAHPGTHLSQLGQKPQSNQDSRYTSNSYTQSEISQFGKKPSTTQTASQDSFQKTQFGSTGSQFGQKQPSTSGTVPTITTVSQTVQPSQFNQKPFSNIQASGSAYQKTQFGAFGSEFVKKSESTQTVQTPKPILSSFIQSPEVKQQTLIPRPFGSTFGQFAQKPQAQASAFALNTDSNVAQFSSQAQKNFGSTQNSFPSQPGVFGSQSGQTLQTTQKAQTLPSTLSSSSQSSQVKQQTLIPTQFSSTFGQFVQKPQTQASAFASNTGSNVAQFSGQTQKHFSSTQYSFPSQSGAFGSQLGQKLQTTQTAQALSPTLSSSSQSSQAKQQTHLPTPIRSTFGQLVQKPQAQASAFASNTASNIAQFSDQTQKHFSSTQYSLPSQFGVFGSQLGQKLQTTQTAQALSPTLSSSSQSSQAKQQTPLPTPIRSTFGQLVQKPQAQASAFASNTASNVAQFSDQTQKHFSSTQYSLPSQSGAFGSQLGQTSQTTQTAQAPSPTLSSSSQSSQVKQQTPLPTPIRSTFGQFVQKPQAQATAFASNTASNVAQFSGQTQKHFSGTQYSFPSQSGAFGSQLGQTLQTTQTAQAPSPTLSSSSQSSQVKQQTPLPTPIRSTFGQFVQKPQAQATAFASNTASNVAPFSGQTQKHFSSTQYSFPSQSGAFGSQLGQTLTQTAQSSSPTLSSSSQSSQIKQQTSLFDSKFGQFVQKPQAQASAFASNTDSNIAQFGNQFASPSRFGQTSQSNIGSEQQAGQFSFGGQTQKPFEYQLTQTSDSISSQLNQGQKLVGSTQQGIASQIGQSVSSQGDQKTQSTQSSAHTTPAFGQFIQSSVNNPHSFEGYNYKKPQSTFNTGSRFGEQINRPQDQKTQPTQTSFNSQESSFQTNFAGQSIKPFGGSSTVQQIQSAVDSTQFSVQPTKLSSFNAPNSQTLLPEFSSKPFTSTVTTSTQSSKGQGSSFEIPIQTQKPTIAQTQNLVGSTSQFVAQPTQSATITSQKPSQSVETQFNGAPVQPSVFSSSKGSNFPSKLGSNLSAAPERPIVSTGQTPIATIVPVPGYELNLNSYQGNFVGQEAEFGGPRDPPRFDDKTGYHY